MTDVRETLMSAEAADRMWDADLLAENSATRSDAPYLLRLLALEILLKRLTLIANGKIDHGHNYAALFGSLPQDQRNRIIANAKQRMGPNADYRNFDGLLNLYSRNFIRLRYPYEAYEGVSEEKYILDGAAWLRAGAPIEEATFQYYPEELTGILYALEQEK